MFAINMNEIEMYIECGSKGELWVKWRDCEGKAESCLLREKGTCREGKPEANMSKVHILYYIISYVYTHIYIHTCIWWKIIIDVTAIFIQGLWLKLFMLIKDKVLILKISIM